MVTKSIDELNKNQPVPRKANYESHGKNLQTAIDGTSDEGIGVLGAGGTEGIFGIGDKAGVYGYSATGAGIYGDSQSSTADAITGTNRGNGKGRGVSGISHTGQGVYGSSTSQAGGVGESAMSDGVLGMSKNPDAAGVAGRNPHGLAGYFDGSVTVTESLSVQGIDVVARIAEIAQSTVTLRGIPIRAPATRPSIKVDGGPASSGVAHFIIAGSGFHGTIIIYITNTATRIDNEVTDLSKLDGTLYRGIEVNCKSGDVLTFTATDQRNDPSDITGMLWSNTETLVCK